MKPRRLREGAIWREADGEIIAIDDHHMSYVSTNGTGTLLWKQLAAGASIEELADGLVSTFGIDRSRAESDVRTFVANLDEKGFLEP
jgi:Coenzyme PQQ synthesis protein D (PqqD)